MFHLCGEGIVLAIGWSIRWRVIVHFQQLLKTYKNLFSENSNKKYSYMSCPSATKIDFINWITRYFLKMIFFGQTTKLGLFDFISNHMNMKKIICQKLKTKIEILEYFFNRRLSFLLHYYSFYLSTSRRL